MLKDELKGQIIHGLYVIKECMIYLTTLSFSLLAIFSAATFCFLVPLLIEPALATLQHKFLPTRCKTISGEWLEGKNQCDWSSCREGCTKEVFNCWKIRVQYVANESDVYSTNEGNLFPNVYGCGYPPRIVCTDFAGKYGKADSEFDCFYSSVDQNIVITHLDQQEISDTLVYGVSIPCAVFSISIIYLILAYIHIYPRTIKEDSSLELQKQYQHVPEKEEETLSPEELIKKKHRQEVDNDRKIFRQQLYTEQNKFIDF